MATPASAFDRWSLRPPPVALTARRLADGTIRFGCTRRSRIGWTWIDGADAPLGEDSERYRLEIVPAAGAARTIETDAPGYDYSPGDQASDGAAGAITVTLSQLGTRAPSRPPALAVWTL